MGEVEQRTAVVTGGSRGLGRAIAIRFAEAGYHVAVGYRRRAKEAELTLAEVNKAGGTGAVYRFDVSDGGAVRSAFTEIFDARARVDVLVNNAGCARDQAFGLTEDDDWRRPIDVNLTGAYHCSRAVVRHMVAGAGGVIINVASVAGYRASPGQSSYAASKGGLMALTSTLAAELAPAGVRVNAVVPGFLNTGLTLGLDRRRWQERLARVPVGRAGTGREVANVVAFLASDEAGYVVGQSWVVDGGLSL